MGSSTLWRYNTSMKNYRFIIRGKVQGVWYRKTVQGNAQKKRFSGYVRNLPDGTVEAGVTCDASRLEVFMDILRQGSTASRVDAIEQFEGTETHHGSFEVR